MKFYRATFFDGSGFACKKLDTELLNNNLTLKESIMNDTRTFKYRDLHLLNYPKNSMLNNPNNLEKSTPHHAKGLLPNFFQQLDKNKLAFGSRVQFH